MRLTSLSPPSLHSAASPFRNPSPPPRIIHVEEYSRVAENDRTGCCRACRQFRICGAQNCETVNTRVPLRSSLQSPRADVHVRESPILDPLIHICPFVRKLCVASSNKVLCLLILFINLLSTNELAAEATNRDNSNEFNSAD